MNIEFIQQLITDYPLTTPLVSITGSLALDDFFGRTLNAWPDVRQIVNLFS